MCRRCAARGGGFVLTRPRPALPRRAVASPGRGILAIDESNATCGKRLDSIGVENTEDNRRAYRELLLTTPGLGQYISGAILFEETLFQNTSSGKSFVQVMNEQKIIPGIKVDKVCGPRSASQRLAGTPAPHGRPPRCVGAGCSAARLALPRSGR